MEQSRLVVVETVSFQRPGESAAAGTDNRFGRFCETDEQPWRRIAKVGPEWEPLDLGWLVGKPVAMLVIENTEGQYFTVNPSAEEEADVKRRVIEIAFASPYHAPAMRLEPFGLVRPGESSRFEPAGDLRLRCRHGSARIVVNAFPG